MSYGMYGNQGGRGGGVNYSSVSYDTSSQDPVLVRSRVFVGNVSNQNVTREQLIDMYSQYGHVLGLTFFKGFAFIQYSNEQDAQRAVVSTNGLTLAGVQIDVKLAALHQQKGGKRPGPAAMGGGGGGGKRDLSSLDGGGGGGGGYNKSYNNAAPYASSAATPAPKMARFSTPAAPKPAYAPAAKQINEKNATAAAADTTKAEDLASRDMADTMICGTCRQVFTDFVKYRDHRKEPCLVPSKPEAEPAEVVCFVCKETFSHSWTLLGHLSKLHHLTVYASDTEPVADANDKGAEMAAKIKQDAA